LNTLLLEKIVGLTGRMLSSSLSGSGVAADRGVVARARTATGVDLERTIPCKADFLTTAEASIMIETQKKRSYDKYNDVVAWKLNICIHGAVEVVSCEQPSISAIMTSQLF
jgi:hypothetical protein